MKTGSRDLREHSSSTPAEECRKAGKNIFGENHGLILDYENPESGKSGTFERGGGHPNERNAYCFSKKTYFPLTL
jgi:hypothetical protein